MRSPEEYRDGLTGTNEKYDEPDINLGGSYRTSAEPFSNPKDVVYFAGFGANAADLERGYCKPNIRQNPEYVLDNYKLKWTEYSVEDEDYGLGGDDLPPDVNFRAKDRETKGLFVRPHIPTER